MVMPITSTLNGMTPEQYLAQRARVLGPDWREQAAAKVAARSATRNPNDFYYQNQPAAVPASTGGGVQPQSVGNAISQQQPQRQMSRPVMPQQQMARPSMPPQAAAPYMAMSQQQIQAAAPYMAMPQMAGAGPQQGRFNPIQKAGYVQQPQQGPQMVQGGGPLAMQRAQAAALRG